MPKKSKSLSKNQKLILIVLAVFLILEVVLFMTGILEFNGDMIRSDQDPDGQEEVSTTTEEGIPEMTTEIDEDATSTEADEVVEVEGDSESDEQLGMYTVTVSSEGYSPDSLVIEEGTIVSVTFKAQDGTYDFHIPATGNYLQAEAGEEDESSFRINETGTYRFECRDFCPASGKIQGTLQVSPQE